MPLRTTPRLLFAGRLPQILAHLPQFARLYWRLFRDRRVSLLAKAWLVLVALYVISPIDLVPFWVPVVGQVDDLLLVLGGLWLYVRLCPPAVVREHVLRISGSAAT
ncbi:MAG: YkvA family protein [Candidatus Binatia bacterium]